MPCDAMQCHSVQCHSMRYQIRESKHIKQRKTNQYHSIGGCNYTNTPLRTLTTRMPRRIATNRTNATTLSTNRQRNQPTHTHTHTHTHIYTHTNYIMSQTTFRFKFTKQLLNSIREFSKIHSNDNCDDFLEAFQSWTYENREMIQLEEKRLKSMGFNKDINAKIYKSARYYFKNKKNKTKQNDAVKVNSNIK